MALFHLEQWLPKNWQSWLNPCTVLWLRPLGWLSQFVPLTPVWVPIKTLLLLTKSGVDYCQFPPLSEPRTPWTLGVRSLTMAHLSFPPSSPSLVVPICSPLDASMHGSFRCVCMLNRESLLSYSWLTCWNLRGRNQGDISYCHSSDVVLQMTSNKYHFWIWFWMPWTLRRAINETEVS